MCLIVLLLHVAWHMSREETLAVHELKGEANHNWVYWFKLEKFVVEVNITPVLNLLSAFVGITYLNEKMDGVFFPLALLVLVAGLIWQDIELVIVTSTMTCHCSSCRSLQVVPDGMELDYDSLIGINPGGVSKHSRDRSVKTTQHSVILIISARQARAIVIGR